MPNLPVKGAPRGFTILELIIVVIIVGVLASLALPRFISMIERAKAAEALTMITQIRGAVERCYLMRNDKNVCECTIAASHDWQRIGMENPSDSPGAYFDYGMWSCNSLNGTYTIFVYPKNRPSSEHRIVYIQTPAGVRIYGEGMYNGLNFGDPSIK